MTLMRWFGGVAPSGAALEVELTQDGRDYVVISYSAAHEGGPRRAWPAVYRGGDQSAAALAWAKLAREKQRGRDRAYRTPFQGTQFAPPAGQVRPMAEFGTERLRDASPFAHPQVWIAGQPLDTLAPQHHHRVSGQAVAPALQQATLLTADAVADTACPWPVALCKTIEHRPEDRKQHAVMEAYIASDHYVLMRKIEGRRAIIERTVTGVKCWSRTGTPQGLPPQVVAMVERMPVGTVLDGELVQMDEHGREALYTAGSVETIVVAYDILKVGVEDVRQKAQALRLRDLELVLRGAHRGDGKAPIRLVPMAWSPTEKRAMLDRCFTERWEGVVVRKLDATYQDGRSGNWLRYKTLRNELDVVVLGYEPGTGRLKGSVGAVQVGLYRGGQLINVGRVGGGWDDTQRAELLRRWQAGLTHYVVRITAEGLSKADGATPKLNRPSGVDLRDGDQKPITDCTWVQ